MGQENLGQHELLYTLDVFVPIYSRILVIAFDL